MEPATPTTPQPVLLLGEIHLTLLPSGSAEESETQRG